MNTVGDLLNTGLAQLALSEVVGRIGWALVHFLWQGAAIAGLLWLALRLLARRRPQVRYAVASLALLLMAAAPLATFLVVQPAGQDVRRPAQTSGATYPEDDSWGKGAPLKVPAEFREGTATLEQAKAWCRALAVGSCFGNGYVIEVEHRELVPGGEQAVVVFDPSCGGSGGRGPQLIFSRTPKGLRFLGDLSGSWRAAPPDALGRPRLVGYWRLGGGEGKASLIVLTSRGFVPVAYVDASGGDGAADEQRRTWRTLFEEPVSQKTLAATFGEDASSRTSLPDMEKGPDLAAATAGPVADDAVKSGDGQHWTSRVSAWAEPAMPYAVVVWLAGVLACSVWHVGGWAKVQRLRRGAQLLADGPNERHWQFAVRRLTDVLRIRRTVRLLKLTGAGARDLAGPVVVGVLRPAVLIPAAVLTGLTPSQVEAVLAHELAHVRRHDYFVNLLQTLVETLLFYHPAVWWASARIRAERENCCDDLAASAVGNSHAYAAALAALAEIAVAQQPARPAGILARLVTALRQGSGQATRGRRSSADRIAPGAKTNLLSRIRRLLGVDVGSSPRWTAALVGVILLTGLLAGIAFYGCTGTMRNPQPKEPANEEPSEPLRLVSQTIRSEKDNLGPWSIFARVEETGAGQVVGLSWQTESLTFADGTVREVRGQWREGDPEELAYAKPSVKVTGFRAELPRQPRQPCVKARLRLKVALAQRIERLEIPDFQLDREYRLVGQGYTKTIRGMEAIANGDHPGISLQIDGEHPVDLSKALNSGVFVLPGRSGFVGEDGTLITPSGSGKGLTYLGRDWVGRTFAIETPVGIRLVETEVEFDLPWKQANPPRNTLAFSPARAIGAGEVEALNPFASRGPRIRRQVDCELTGPGTLVGLNTTATLADGERVTGTIRPPFNSHQVGPILFDLPENLSDSANIPVTYSAVVADSVETFVFDKVAPDQQRSDKKKQTIERKGFRPIEMPLARVDVATRRVDDRLQVELAVCRYTDDVVAIEPRLANWRIVLVDSKGRVHEPTEAKNPQYALSGDPETYMFRAGRQVVAFADGWQDGKARLEVALPAQFSSFTGEADVSIQPSTTTQTTTQAARRDVRIVNRIELVDKDDLPAGMYCQVPSYAKLPAIKFEESGVGAVTGASYFG